MPNLIADYDAIGFDTEHTLVKFNNDEMARLMISTVLEDLVENFGYPAETANFDYENNLSMCMTNAVWDLEHGTVIKLAGNKEIFQCL